jgi:hypothetical protein
MPAFEPRRALVPLLSLLERSTSPPSDRPSHHEETTRHPLFPWDLHTLIIVFPSNAPFRFLNLNTTLGLTGVPLDQPEAWTGSSARDAFDLQFCLEAKHAHASFKRYYSVSRDLDVRADEVWLRLGERFHLEGSWPGYRIQYRQPEIDLELSVELGSWPGLHWWARAPRLYCHYTSFCDCRIEWRWGAEEGELDLPALHDHGWGRNMLPLRTPLKVFRYEVLRLPAGDFAISLWTEGPWGMELRNVGLVRWGRQPPLFMRRYRCEVLEWEEFDNYAGLPCRVPRRWTGTQLGEPGEFHYEALRSSEPRAVFGEGFLYGFDYQGRFEGTGPPSQHVEGSGYVEHLGRFTR